MVRTPVRIAIVGAGWWSSHAHIPAVLAHPDAELVAILDEDLGRAREARQVFGLSGRVAALQEPDELLPLDLDAAIIATPQNAHHAMAARLLDAGVDVLVEKPLTIDPVEAWDLVERARISGAALHVGHTFPHSPQVAAVKDLVQEGRVGALVLCSAVFATAVAGLYKGETAFARDDTAAPFAARPGTYSDPASGGQLFSQASHAAAVLLHVSGDAAVSVLAQEHRGGLAVDLADTMSARLASGTIVSLASVGNVERNDRRLEEYRFFGEDGHVLLDTVSGDLSVVEGAAAVQRIRPEEHGRDLSREPARNLIEAALGREAVMVPGELGARVVDMMSMARESARSSRGGRR